MRETGSWTLESETKHTFDKIDGKCLALKLVKFYNLNFEIIFQASIELQFTSFQPEGRGRARRFPLSSLQVRIKSD